MINPTKPTEHNGIIYPSRKALAAVYGVHPATVTNAIKRGRLDRLGRGTPPPPIEAAREARKQPCAACGWFWPSQKEAAEAIGCSRSCVSGALNRGTFDKLVMRRLGVRT